MIILWHASPVKIDAFDFSKGVHFGSKESAFQAVLRKAEDLDVIYLHKVTLVPFNSYESEDVGNAVEWARVEKHAFAEGYTAIKYLNKYEPSTKPSYVLLTNQYITDVTVEEIPLSFVEEFLDKNTYCWDSL